MSSFFIHLDHAASLDLSIVIPVRDEAENIPGLAAEIGAALGGTPWRWECLWVDDGSRDGTAEELTRLHERDDRHRFLSLDGRHGQGVALAVGFQHARGAVLATLDGDGQNDPSEIRPLVGLMNESVADLVNGWRRQRQDGFVRTISSRIGNGFRNWVTGDRVRDVGCSLRVFRRECVDGLPVFAGMHRFLPTLIRMNGYDRILEVPVSHRPRRHGRSKYGIRNRLWVALADALAVRWMARRTIRARIRRASTSPAQEVVAA